MKRPRRNHSAASKAKAALAAIRGDKTLAQLAERLEVHPNQITQWKSPLLERSSSVLGGDAPAPDSAATIRALQAKIGQLTSKRIGGWRVTSTFTIRSALIRRWTA